MMPEPEGPGEPLAPQYLADQLTLFKPGVGRLCPPLPLAPPKFFTFRHHWSRYVVLNIGMKPLPNIILLKTLELKQKSYNLKTLSFLEPNVFHAKTAITI